MRTSNKILLGILLFAMLVFAFPVIWVRAKVASGGLVTRPRAEGNYSNEMISIKDPVKAVDIANLGSIVIIPSDSLRVEFPGGKQHKLFYHVKDGVLFLNTDTTVKNGGGAVDREYSSVKLYLPAMDSVVTRNADLTLRIGDDSSHAKPAFVFKITFTNLAIEGSDNNPPAGVIDQLTVEAGPGSNINFNGFLHILSGTYKLLGASFEDNTRVRYDKLKIQADDNAGLNMKGQNLRNAIITSTE
jgi:hypothetical protein